MCKFDGTGVLAAKKKKKNGTNLFFFDKEGVKDKCNLSKRSVLTGLTLITWYKDKNNKRLWL